MGRRRKVGILVHAPCFSMREHRAIRMIAAETDAALHEVVRQLVLTHPRLQKYLKNEGEV